MFQFDHVRTRFAPSPTGYMHVGNLRTALFAYLVAKSNNGRFLLRIEDTDQERQVEGAVEIIYKTLKETGLQWDEGPDIGGPVGPYIQSQRMGMFKKYAEQLVESGHAYYCFCDKERLDEVRKVQEASGIAPRYDGHCRNLSKEKVAEKLAAGIPYVIRQKVPTEGTVTFHDEVYGDVTVECSTLDDQILIKGDGMPTYNFANVVDDHTMGITHVIRAQVQPAVRGVRLGDPEIHSLRARHAGRHPQALQAARRRLLRGPGADGLFDPGHPQLHCAAGLEPQG